MRLINDRTIIRRVTADMLDGGMRGWYDYERMLPVFQKIDPETIGRAQFLALHPISQHWLARECGECGATNVDLVEIGEEAGYDTMTAQVCAACLSQALQMVTARG